EGGGAEPVGRKRADTEWGSRRFTKGGERPRVVDDVLEPRPARPFRNQLSRRRPGDRPRDEDDALAGGGGRRKPLRDMCVDRWPPGPLTVPPRALQPRPPL